MLESATTSAITMRLMASTSFVLRRMRGAIAGTQSSVLGTQYSVKRDVASYVSTEKLTLSSVAVGGCAYRRSVFLQFIVQRFETDAQNLSSAGLVIVG